MTDPGSTAHAGAFVEQLAKPQRKIFAALEELVAHQERSLNWYYRTGSKLNELQDAAEKRDPGWVKDLAAALELSKSNLVKMRKFASDFTLAEVQQLEQQGSNWGMITVIQHVSVKNRKEFLQQALAKGWNISDLKAAVQRRFGAHHAGGRPLRKPKTARGGVCELERLSERWLRYYQEVWTGDDDPLQDKVREPTMKERQALVKLIPRVRETIRKVRKATLEANRFLGEMEKKLKKRLS